MRWRVYILESQKDGSFYTGISTDVGRRVKQHNGRRSGGAKYTRTRRPWALRLASRLMTRRQAMKLERQIKRLPRHKKISKLEKFI